jgi:hypothetical protein
MKVRRRRETAMAGYILKAWVSLSLAGCSSRADQKPLE